MYCEDFYPCVDRDEVLSYVESNKEWFSERINGFGMPEVQKKISDILDKYNRIRIARDNNENNDAISLYNELEQLCKGD